VRAAFAELDTLKSCLLGTGSDNSKALAVVLTRLDQTISVILDYVRDHSLVVADRLEKLTAIFEIFPVVRVHLSSDRLEAIKLAALAFASAPSIDPETTGTVSNLVSRHFGYENRRLSDKTFPCRLPNRSRSPLVDGAERKRPKSTRGVPGKDIVPPSPGERHFDEQYFRKHYSPFEIAAELDFTQRRGKVFADLHLAPMYCSLVVSGEASLSADVHDLVRRVVEDAVTILRLSARDRIVLPYVTPALDVLMAMRPVLREPYKLFDIKELDEFAWRASGADTVSWSEANKETLHEWLKTYRAGSANPSLMTKSPSEVAVWIKMKDRVALIAWVLAHDVSEPERRWASAHLDQYLRDLQLLTSYAYNDSRPGIQDLEINNQGVNAEILMELEAFSNYMKSLRSTIISSEQRSDLVRMIIDDASACSYTNYRATELQIQLKKGLF